MTARLVAAKVLRVLGQIWLSALGVLVLVGWVGEGLKLFVSAADLESFTGLKRAHAQAPLPRKLRHDIAHRGVSVSPERASNAIKAAEKYVQHLLAVVGRVQSGVE
jgi:hypothetical protein